MYECFICLDFFILNESYYMNCCKHHIHVKCLVIFIVKNNEIRCPMCNTQNFGLCGSILKNTLLIEYYDTDETNESSDTSDTYSNTDSYESYSDYIDELNELNNQNQN